MALYVKFECSTCENKNCTGHGLQTTEKVCDGYKHTTTNADRIRAMSDEELAELFEMIPHSGNPATYTIDGFCIDDGLRTKRQWLDWLKQEVKE